MRRKDIVARIVIAIMALLLLWVALSNLGNIWTFIRKNPARVYGVVAGGVIASLLASLMLYVFVDRPFWQRDVEDLKNGQTAVEKGLKSLEDELPKLRGSFSDAIVRYETLLDRLPTALSGNFTSSVLQYFPRTSHTIATILGDEAEAAYTRHFERVIVTQATDTYRVAGLKVLSIGDQRFLFWNLDFHVSWYWLNDSNVPRHPFQEFMLVLSAPDEAMNALLGSCPASEEEGIRHRFGEFAARQNYVRALAAHPSGVEKLLSPDEAGKMFTVKELTWSHRNRSASTVPQSDFVPLESALPPLVYGAYQMPHEMRKEVLAVNERMSVEYSGSTMIPAVSLNDGYGPITVLDGSEELHLRTLGKVGGSMSYSPSDMVAEKYTLNFIYPRLPAPNADNDLYVEVDRTSSRLMRRYAWDRDAKMSAASTALRTRLQCADQDGLDTMVADGPFTDLCQINLVWRSSNGA